MLSHNESAKNGKVEGVQAIQVVCFSKVGVAGVQVLGGCSILNAEHI